LDRFAHVVRWQILPAAVQARALSTEPERPDEFSIEFWADYACGHCLNSADALMNLREQLREEPIAWRFRFLPRGTEESSVGFLWALAGQCSEEPWLLFYHAAAERDLSERALSTFLERQGLKVESCMASTAAPEAIWQDRLEAARRGILVTPTLVVDGTRLEGELRLEPVAALIQERVRRRKGS